MPKTAICFMHSSENMPEVEDDSVDFMIGASVYLGKDEPWYNYETLYGTVYGIGGLKKLKRSGVFVVIQTNAYESGRFNCRYAKLVKFLTQIWNYKLIDERVWQRRKADHFQVPFSHVLVFRPPGGTVTRNDMNKRSKAWFQGVWDYPQGKGGELNSYPEGLCRLLVNACTDPGDTILDPFAGTGKLLSIAAQLGRDAIGYEINKELIPVLKSNGVKTISSKSK